MIFYNIIYFSFWDKKGPRKTAAVPSLEKTR
jgi:hypothetical protein